MGLAVRLPAATPAPTDGAAFWTVAFRSFEVRELEDGEEDYGQAALYRGTIPGCAHHFRLDAENHFETGRAAAVGGNTARILEASRLAPHFRLLGSRSRHFGPFWGGALTAVRLRRPRPH